MGLIPSIRLASCRFSPFGLCAFRVTASGSSGSPVTLGPTTGFPSPPGRSSLLRREVEGRVLIAQEHQPSPPEPDVRLVTASGSHGISYVFVVGAQVSVRSSVTRPSQPPKIEADSLESFLPILLVV